MFTKNVDLIKDKILQSLLIFAIPIFISNVFQQLYNAADTMIVGNILGDSSLAAIGTTTAVFDLLIGFALGVGNGLSIVVARNYGAKNEQLLKKSVAGAIVIGLGLTIIIMIISNFGLFSILELLDTPIEIIEEAHSYISVITTFVGIMFAYNLCAGLLRAIGNSMMPLLFLIVSSILNIVLDILFIRDFGMGIAGAAIATVIAQLVSVVLCILYIYKKAPILIPRKEDFSFDKSLYIELAGQGFSMGFMMAIVSAGTVILQKAINGFGYLIIAGHTAARRINSFFMMPCGTLAITLATFVSQNKGADQRERIKQGVKIANRLAIGWGILATVILLLFGKNIVMMVSGSKEAIVLDNATQYLLINAPFYAVLGILLNLRNSLQGLGEKVIPLVSSIIELFGKIVFVMFFVPILGYFGVIISEPIIWCLMCIQLVYSFYSNSYLRGNKNEN